MVKSVASDQALLGLLDDSFKSKDYRRCIELVGEHAEPELLLFRARSSYRLEEYHQALATFLQIVSIAPRQPDLYFRLALVYENLRDIQNAIKSYKKAIELDASDLSSHFNLGLVYDSIGEHEKSKPLFDKCLQEDPLSSRCLLQVSYHHRFKSKRDPEFLRISHALASPKLTPAERSHCYYALGRAYQSLGEFEQAWVAFQAANSIQHGLKPFHFTRYERRVDNILQNAISSEKVAPESDGSEKFCFVLGLPRSGKTLVQTCLEEFYPTPFVADETGIIGSFVEDVLHSEFGIDFPGDWSGVSAAQLAEIQVRCVGRFQAIGFKSHDMVFDTSPNNHRYLGFLASVFPRAKYISCTRDPLDHCLQLFLNYFSGGNSYSNDVSLIGHYLNLYYREMNWWKGHLEIEVHEIEYERLVGEFDFEIGRMAKWLKRKGTSKMVFPSMRSDEIGLKSQFGRFLAPAETLLNNQPEDQSA